MSRDNKGPSPNGPLMPRPSPLRKRFPRRVSKWRWVKEV